MRVIGFLPCHYGVEYLKECLTSIKDHCEKVVVSYTANGSHGFQNHVPCPDKEEDIYRISLEVLGDKLIWDRAISYRAENVHRAVVHKYSQGYDLVLSIDADEVYKTEDLQTALEYAYNNKERDYGINGYINFWRSFSWACYDGFRPIRIENLNNANTLQNLNCPLTVYHFSTAQSETIMRYKYHVFGHANEIKPDWLNKIHYGWTPENNFGDLHPVSINLWNAVPFDKNTLPESLKNHPNFNKELI